ncbi:MAG: phosphoribosylglycinamide formyltransferase [Clostridiales bacterium]|nr:phosphoribosylglycinamide formyltransferase [Candidatus Crickella merdequi]
MDNKARIAVLVSGGGTNLQAIIDAQNSGVIKSGEVCLVISNKADAYALQRAKNAGIEARIITRKKGAVSELGIPVTECTRETFEDEIIKAIDEKNIDIIVLAGFMCILSEKFTSHYEERILNVHPSLIPSFCGEGFYGLKVHEAALEKGVKVTGATVHFVNEIPDGGRIIAQKAVCVEDGDTPEILQKRVMEQAEWIILPESIERISYERVHNKTV